MPTPVSALLPSNRPPISKLGVRSDSSESAHAERPSNISRKRCALPAIFGKLGPEPGYNSVRNASDFSTRPIRRYVINSCRAPTETIRISRSVFTRPASSLRTKLSRSARNKPYMPNPDSGAQCAHGKTLVIAQSTSPSVPSVVSQSTSVRWKPASAAWRRDSIGSYGPMVAGIVGLTVALVKLFA